jgi:hypothetical protein
MARHGSIGNHHLETTFMNGGAYAGAQPKEDLGMKMIAFAIATATALAWGVAVQARQMVLQAH